MTNEALLSMHEENITEIAKQVKEKKTYKFLPFYTPPSTEKKLFLTEGHD